MSVGTVDTEMEDITMKGGWNFTKTWCEKVILDMLRHKDLAMRK